MIIAIIYAEEIALLLGNEKIKFWLYLAPLSIFFVGFFNALNYYATRIKNFNGISYANVTKSFILSLIQISAGVVCQGAAGLISVFISQVLASLVFSRTYLAHQRSDLIFQLEA